ncbi:TetR family transcriptional regulator [Caballeronia novacaledonica]|uniref:TetR family transcriptional regulator n=1 Tax=Caballeronia novacaledonica TaxID=1544861 RepID=A0A2U3I3S0_9BURK|nr:TniQ family protein [Caballeronia novacaledonica]SPB14784.1 TetR family transcriptional regulator [Caballeronia novacaledonica]
MNEVLCPPRSALYALEPIGVGTANVESLVSFFCRLAVTHCVSSTDLLHRISKTCGLPAPAKNFWKDVNLSGMGDVAERYACALSEMTSVERLDSLTLRPWRNVIAQRSQAPAKGRWCGACFEEDLANEGMPYFRLAWDVGDLEACAKDHTRLTDTCPDCGRTGARNNAVWVVPGWCCYCGAFLGGVRTAASSATLDETWKAAQVGQLLAAQSSISSVPDRGTMIAGILKLVEQLDGGMSARFARRIGLNKSTVHYWLKQGGVPTLAAHLRIASQTGVSLVALLTGAIGDSVVSLHESPSLAELVPDYKKRALPVHRDTAEIEAIMDKLRQSDVAISVSEAARRMKVRRRQLYRLEHEKTRRIGARWEEHQHACTEQHRREAARAIEVAVEEILSSGKAPNFREVQQMVPRNVLGAVRGVIAMIQEAKRKIEGSRSATLP